MNQLSREQLINSCEQAIIPIDKCYNEESRLAQEQLEACLNCLKAEKEFKIEQEGIYFTIIKIEQTSFFIPTQRRLEKKREGDWYY